MEVVVDGLITSYLRTGSGAPVLVLPGWADVAANWHSFAHELGKDFEVIVPDLPGFGGSHAPETAWDVSDYAQFIGAMCQKLDFQPTVIIGHSNGGGIAVRGLANGALHAQALVLLASAGVRGEGGNRNMLLKAVAKTGKIVSSPLSLITQQKLRRKLYGAVGSDMLVAEHMQETFKKVVADDVRADAARLQLPTLLVYGDADTATPISFGQKLHDAIGGSRLEIVAGADHFLYRSHQAEVLQLAKSFMKESHVQ